jgi:hypothetical protein
MKVVASDDEGSHLGVGDGDALWVEVLVDLAANCEAGFGGRRSDQVDDRSTALHPSPRPSCGPHRRRTRSSSSGSDSSRKPRPMVLAAIRVAIDTAAIAPQPAAAASAAATTRRPRSFRNGATAEKPCRMAATSIIRPRYGILAALRTQYLPSPNSRFVYCRTDPKQVFCTAPIGVAVGWIAPRYDRAARRRAAATRCRFREGAGPIGRRNGPAWARAATIPIEVSPIQVSKARLNVSYVPRAHCCSPFSGVDNVRQLLCAAHILRDGAASP